jgi:hypothetical protein
LAVGIFRAAGAEAPEFGERFAESADRAGAEAVDTTDGGRGEKSVAGPRRGTGFRGEIQAGGAPGLGFEPGVAAEHPFAMDELVDERALGGGGGPVLGAELLDQLFEQPGAFVADDVAARVYSGFESVLTGYGLALGGAWAGAELCVATIGVELLLRRHGNSKKNAPTNRGSGRLKAYATSTLAGE